MMKRLFLFLEIMMLIHASIAVLMYLSDFSQLAEYGKGYIFGKLILLLISLLLLLFTLKNSRRRQKTEY